jgi:hypothetical protein
MAVETGIGPRPYGPLPETYPILGRDATGRDPRDVDDFYGIPQIRTALPPEAPSRPAFKVRIRLLTAECSTAP